MKIVNRLGQQDKEIVANIIGAFGVRGISMILSFFTMPIYISFFNDKEVLGIWYTLLSVMNWALYFDLGLGNGLRNKLPECLLKKDTSKAKQYIASTYVSSVVLVICLVLGGYMVIPRVDWLSFLNVSNKTISNETIIRVMKIVYIGILVQFVLKLITSILYAMQRSAIVNLLTLFTTILTLILVLTSPKGSTSENLVRMGVINAVSVNVPFLIATISVFGTKLRKYIPSIKDFTLTCAREVLNIGLMLLWLQIVFMIISNTNEILISHLTSSENVVQYQAYNRIFNTVSSIFTLGLTPIWSAVTKAIAVKNNIWIKKLNKRLLLLSIGVMVVELLLVPFLQLFVDLWLGKSYVMVNSCIAVVFVFSNTLMFIHNVNTSFGNGASFFKVQAIWMTLAAVFDIPVAVLLVKIFGSWIGVIIANILVLLPFEIIEIIEFNKYIDNRCGSRI